MPSHPECAACGTPHAPFTACPTGRTLEWAQQRKRPALTKKNSKARKLAAKGPSGSGGGVKKVAPGRKKTRPKHGVTKKPHKLDRLKMLDEIRARRADVVQRVTELTYLLSIGAAGPSLQDPIRVLTAWLLWRTAQSDVTEVNQLLIFRDEVEWVMDTIEGRASGSSVTLYAEALLEP